LPPERVRRAGGGRKALTETNGTLLADLLALVSPGERGDPMSPLRWSCKSLRKLAAELRAIGHRISHAAVGELLTREGFSSQANRKTREGDSHPDRDAQFAHIGKAQPCGNRAALLSSRRKTGRSCWSTGPRHEP
jgi:hypothetical protein